ncbi:uncharacterized protein LOC129771220 [Toxorhynchites rutilus septentrionalis]|uniref:uncharacterized protein LOC129771220 n=1 Tax=Toxorhynchites rutilus septentrionalis TaxID=329112 RepID=UPI002479DF75|nr:uncharacterized protein LOC129771220 [Toxorhynchites rutilus septentrionalis]
MLELQRAERYLLRCAQQESYPAEYAILRAAKKDMQASFGTVPKDSKLYQLTPFLDDNGLIRMRRRTRFCTYIFEDAKNPIVLPRGHHVTDLIIKHYHEKLHHQNHEAVMNEIRQKYRIPRLRCCYASVRRGCQRCKNEKKVPQPPVMADLPPVRLAAFSRPFTHVGVDYFGPIEVSVGRRVEKRWGMLITCLTVRAIHIEVVHSLTASSCVMGLRNFISRRGVPRTIYSDRGTNFVGANRELETAYAALNQNELMKEFVTSNTSWVFIPPASPHMGGCWERLIRTVKKNLMAIQVSRKPSDEVLRNMLTEIENTVNSRPLTHVPIDDISAPALTPNDLLRCQTNSY